MSADLRLSDYAYQFGLIDSTRYEQVVRKRQIIQQTFTQLDDVTFTSSRLIEACAQEAGIDPLGQCFRPANCCEDQRYAITRLHSWLAGSSKIVFGKSAENAAYHVLPMLTDEDCRRG